MQGDFFVGPASSDGKERLVGRTVRLSCLAWIQAARPEELWFHVTSAGCVRTLRSTICCTCTAAASMRPSTAPMATLQRAVADPGEHNAHSLKLRSCCTAGGPLGCRVQLCSPSAWCLSKA